jgi:hypothetical protein
VGGRGKRCGMGKEEKRAEGRKEAGRVLVF